MELLQTTEAKIVILVLALVMIFFLVVAVRNRRLILLSSDAKRLLNEARADRRSAPRGISIYRATQESGSYVPFRWSPQLTDEVELFTRDISGVLAAVKELVNAGFLVPEKHIDNWEIYRLAEDNPPAGSAGSGNSARVAR